jgi:hypothetical protein
MKRPPNLDEVLNRANAIAARYVRARVEGGVHFSSGASKARWTKLGLRLQRWATKAPALTAKERKLHELALGGWPEREVVHGEWSLEALGLLLWVLRWRPLRPWHSPYGPDVLPWVDIPSWYNESGPITAGRPAPRLRSLEERAEMEDRAEAWHWRAVTAQRPLDPRTKRIVADAAAEAERRGWLSVCSGDFPYRGKPYVALGADARSSAWSIAVERHRAAAWSTGGGSWERVRIDT